ncbi:hypothetical protein [Mycobacterium sp. IS-1556]|uniref:hypothetical protein n=1 Tax=Mycobacterium sp. IS-1556 TaxID=1772276 RepID=UPI00074157D7|nr:hypothetical protein [Mycobacterium sp. IS-1556]KUH90621.1 hypothetical protein AU187_24425 [Mycobacterium sp. IS-1556]
MRIKTDNGNDIIIAHRANGGAVIEQGQSHILLNRTELHLFVGALNDFTREYQPPPRLQRFVGGVEQF